MADRLKGWAERLQSETVTLWFCTRHARTPLVAKALALALVAYAFSPIDLIPDFIPVLGYLDDLLILPAGVWVVLKLIPADVMAECRAAAAAWLAQRRAKPTSYAGAAVIAALWLVLLWLAYRWWIA